MFSLSLSQAEQNCYTCIDYTIIAQVKYRLGVNPLDLLWSNSLSFIVVRHPLDRLISAYRDRILDPRTDQARRHSSAMLKFMDNLSSLQKQVPSFSQFLQYIAGK